MKLSDVAEALGGRLVGDGAVEIERPVHPAEVERPTDLALAMDRRTLALLEGSGARAAVVAENAEVPEGLLAGYVRVGRPRYAMAGLTDLFRRPDSFPPGVHPAAAVEDGAEIAEDVHVGPFVHVAAGASIGAGSVLMSHATVGPGARIGRGCLLHPGVRIGARVVVGDRAIIHHNASIGADGFSFVTPEPGSVETAKTRGRIEATNEVIVRIHSLGAVVIGDDVEIGACTAIDRGTVADTRVGSGTKIDDLVMIGHNCVIGENCMICGQVGLAGSVTLGDRVVLGGRVGIADHLTVGNDSLIAAGSGVACDVPAKAIYYGSPAMPKQEAYEWYMATRRFKSVFKDIEALKRRVRELEAAAGRESGPPDERSRNKP